MVISWNLYPVFRVYSKYCSCVTTLYVCVSLCSWLAFFMRKDIYLLSVDALSCFVVSAAIYCYPQLFIGIYGYVLISLSLNHEEANFTIFANCIILNDL